MYPEILDVISNYPLNMYIVCAVRSELYHLQPEVGTRVLNTKGVVVELGALVVEHTVMVLLMVPFAPHSAVIQFPIPSVVS